MRVHLLSGHSDAIAGLGDAFMMGEVLQGREYFKA
jgi:hypothetical protein